ncbi:MAG: glycosyltransferase family 9 protein [Deltaproteobacteria bacterium]|nr:glycosyltransferase family 9 protein [Deltaproteobacteria bacterium]
MPRLPALLIVHQGALGDLVCIFPVIAALRRYFCPVGILCQEHLGRLAAAEGLVEAWFPIEAAWTASLFAGAAGLEARRLLAPYTHFLVFSRSQTLVSALQRIGDTRVCRIPPRPPADQRIHVTEHALEHIRGCGLLPERERTLPETVPFTAPPVEKNRSKTVLIHPGAGSRRKRWPLSGFWDVARQLGDLRLSPEFVIGPAEQDLLPGLARREATVHRPGGSIELLALLRSAAAYIGNDSGASHLAAWAQLPSVVIFGPTDPMRWRPRGRSVEIVQPPLDCVPCFETAAENCAAADCLARITPGNVMEAFQRVVRTR